MDVCTHTEREKEREIERVLHFNVAAQQLNFRYPGIGQRNMNNNMTRTYGITRSQSAWRLGGNWFDSRPKPRLRR